ncbi:hypothetical protein Pint_21540 [Pistacia integerrima]|uniref:Uncharacterized protein n=1 Tax=Pistacia integerrima TaxID=434235 RepID=A0ACC0XBH7_9ROSI|nr:hypothetical protein Pint_21540 [Pistacia integerrima]
MLEQKRKTWWHASSH